MKQQRPRETTPRPILTLDKRNLSEARGWQSEPARQHRQLLHPPLVRGRRCTRRGAGVIGSCRSVGTHQRGFDCTLDQDRQKAADPGVDELLGGALDLRTHLGLVVLLPVADVSGHQLVFELGQLGIECIVKVKDDYAGKPEARRQKDVVEFLAKDLQPRAEARR